MSLSPFRSLQSHILSHLRIYFYLRTTSTLSRRVHLPAPTSSTCISSLLPKIQQTRQYASKKVKPVAWSFDLKTTEKKMNNIIEKMKLELVEMRIGRANPVILDSVMVTIDESSQIALKDLAQITIKDPQTLLVSANDINLIPQINKSIHDANLNLTPVVDGKFIKVTIPKPTKESRDNLVKQASKIAENFKSRVRQVRQEGMKDLKKDLKTGQGEDENWKNGQEIESLTKIFTKSIEELLKTKTKEIQS